MVHPRTRQTAYVICMRLELTGLPLYCKLFDRRATANLLLGKWRFKCMLGRMSNHLARGILVAGIQRHIQRIHILTGLMWLMIQSTVLVSAL